METQNNPFESELAANHYVLDKQSAIWKRQDHGESAIQNTRKTGNSLKEIMNESNDAGHHSIELATGNSDDESTCFYPAEEANIIRPFEKMLSGADVLHVGSGAGNISSYLGKIGAYTLALDGRVSQAELTRLSTKDLKNVVVLEDDFLQTNIKIKFDFIIIIINEWNIKYLKSGGADEQKTFEHILKLLKPRGQVIIAGEYITDENQKNSIHAVDLKNLRQNAHDVGLSQQHLFRAFPDYTLPECVMSDEAYHCEDFIAFSRNMPVACSRDENKSNISSDKIGSSDGESTFTPSFFPSAGFALIASKPEENTWESKPLAWHFSMNEDEKYGRKRIFHREPNGDIVVETICENGSMEPLHTPDFEFHPAGKRIFFNLPNLATELTKLTSHPILPFDDLVDFFDKYKNSLIDIALREKLLDLERSDDPYRAIEFPGEFFSAIPDKIFINENGAPFYFDRTWRSKHTVTIGQMIFRSIVNLTGPLQKSPTFECFYIRTRLDLIRHLFLRLDIQISDQIIDDYLRAEVAHHNQSHFNGTSEHASLRMIRNKLHSSIAACIEGENNDDKYTNSHVLLLNALDMKDKEISLLQNLIRHNHSELSSCRLALYDIVNDANEVVRHRWWKRTAFMRRLSNSIRKKRGKEKKNWPKSFIVEKYLAKYK